MNKEQKQEALEWLVNDTDPANYIVVDFEGGQARIAVDDTTYSSK